MYEFERAARSRPRVAIQGGGSPVPERIIEVGGHYDASVQSQRHGGDPSPDGPARTASPAQAAPSPVGPPHLLRGPPPLRLPDGPLPVPRVVHLRLAKARSKIKRAHCRVGRVGASSLGAFADGSSRNHRAQASGVARGTRVKLVLGR